MRFGMLLPGMHPWSSMEQAVQLAEASGAESYWFADHLLGLFHPDLFPEMAMSELLADPDAYYDPFLVAAALSRSTGKPMGTAVTDTTRRRAADLARTCLTLQQLCAGGFTLGVGSGEAENIVPFGYPYERPVAVFEEFLVEIRALFDTGRMPDGPGRTGLPLRGPAGAPQVWVGGQGPRMLRLAGTYGDGWIPGWQMPPPEYAQRAAVIAEWAAKAGRPAPTCSLAAPLVVGECREALLEQFDAEPLAKAIALLVGAETWERHGHTHPLDPKSQGFVDTVMHAADPDAVRDLAPGIPAEVVGDFLFLGNADEIVGRIEEYTRHGLEHVVIGYFTGIVGGAAAFQASVPESLKLTSALARL